MQPNADFQSSVNSLFLRTGPFNDTAETQNRFQSDASDQEIARSGNRELTFLGYSFERLGRALDPVLTVISVGRKQTDHLIGSARGRTCDIAGGKVDGLSNPVFMTQRPLHHAKRQLPRLVPLALAD
jgi:hypothetical protein